MAVAVMLAYGRIVPPLGSVIAGGQTHYNGGFQVGLVVLVPTNGLVRPTFGRFTYPCFCV